MVTVILTLFKRPDYLLHQIECIRNQSVSCDIWLDWTLLEDNHHIDEKKLGDDLKISQRRNQNLHVSGRFYYAFNVKTPYIFIVDDDMFPQPNYVKSCLDIMTLKKDKAIITGWGSRFGIQSTDYNKSGGQFGWAYPNEQTTQVDWGGHSWFFTSESLRYFSQESLPFENNGEDLHLSYTSFMYGGIKTYVAPHPMNDNSVWSTDTKLSKKVSNLKALHKRKNHASQRRNIVSHYRKKGWEPLLNTSI